MKIKNILTTFILLLNLTACNEKSHSKNEKVNRENFDKIEIGMSLSKVKSILGETYLHDPTGKSHGLSDVLPDRNNNMVAIWSDGIKSEVMITCVFKDSVLLTKEYND